MGLFTRPTLFYLIYLINLKNEKMKKKMNIEERIVESGLFSFEDGYLGSTNHCVDYYYDWDSKKINEIKNENNLMSLVLDEEYGGDIFDEDEDGNVVNNWSDYFDRWFSDCDEYEIIDDSINGGNGYGKIVVDKVNKSIEIMVVPCLYSSFRSSKKSDIKIFGFDWESGELVREVSNEKLIEILKDEDYRIG